MSQERTVSLTLNLESTTSREDAVSQFIKAVALYGMSSFDFQIYEGEDDFSYLNGREAMIAAMEIQPLVRDDDEEDEDDPERDEEREDDIRTEVRSDLLNEEAEDGRPTP